MQNQFFKLNGHALWMSLNAEFHASYCCLTELNTIFKYITIGRLNYYVSVRVESYICPALSIIQYSWCIGLFCKVAKMCFFINTFNSYTLSAIKLKRISEWLYSHKTYEKCISQNGSRHNSPQYATELKCIHNNDAILHFKSDLTCMRKINLETGHVLLSAQLK